MKFNMANTIWRNNYEKYFLSQCIKINISNNQYKQSSLNKCLSVLHLACMLYITKALLYTCNSLWQIQYGGYNNEKITVSLYNFQR